mgnify:CR=1 FL=1
MESKYDSLTLKNQLCFPIYLCAKEITRKYNHLLKTIDLTYTQYIVMMYFWENKESNVQKISKVLLIDSSTLTPILKTLEKKGYIIRKRSSEDERNLIVSITEKGFDLRDRAIDIPKKIGSCINLSKDDALMLYKLIYKTLVNVEEDLNGTK